MYSYTLKIGSTTETGLTTDFIDPVLVEALNAAPTFSFKLPYTANKSIFRELVTTLEVKDGSKRIFKGRLLDLSEGFNGTITLLFEGELAYLNDVMYEPYNFKGSPEFFFEQVLNAYNQRVQYSRRIRKGTVTVTDPNNLIVRSNEEYSTCWGVIKEKLVDIMGGFLRLREENGIKYLDYLESLDQVATQKIKFGENLLDLEHYIDATAIGTRIIPLGAKDEDTKTRLTIASVNDGKTYLDTDLINIYGVIEKVVIWDDVTVAQNLLTKAQNYIDNEIYIKETIDVKAVDLHVSDAVINAFNLGDMIEIESEPHNISTYMLLSQRTRHLNNVAQDSLTLGVEKRGLTSFVNNVENVSSNTESMVEGQYLSGEILKGANNWLISGGAKLICQYETNVTYTTADREKARRYILGEITLTQEEIEHLDADGNGIVNPADYILIGQIINNEGGTCAVLKRVVIDVTLNGSPIAVTLKYNGRTLQNEFVSYIGGRSIRNQSIVLGNAETNVDITNSSVSFTNSVLSNGFTINGSASLNDVNGVMLQGNNTYIFMSEDGTIKMSAQNGIYAGNNKID